MLESIRIKNVALIDECEINFKKGLNILSGETGAGKSMIIDSLNFALGERVNKDFLREGTDTAKVEVLFSANNNVNDILIDNDIDTEYDGSVLISRTFNLSGKSICRINGDIVNTKTMKLVSEYLIDIHGQHHHQSLLDPKRHIFLLDRFCGNVIEEKLNILESLYLDYKNIIKSINDINGNEMDMAQRLDMLYFQKEDIESANLKIGEEDELNEKRKYLSNMEKIINLCSESLNLLYEGNDNISASDAISKALHNINILSDIDTNISSIAQSLSTVSTLVDDICYELKSYFRNLDYNDNELLKLDERINIIYSLKRKYGKNIEDILNFYDNVLNEIEIIENSEKVLNELNIKKTDIENKINLLCDEISLIRKEKSKIVEKAIENELKDLEMKNASFKINITEKDNFNSNGKDNVEFLISANLGEKLKPLSKTASGGEMSRVMLALKVVLSDVDIIETFIFDEIDTGVSGRTAQRVAEKMIQVSFKNQIICITHLPQIAAMADNHFLIEKKSCCNRTSTKIYELKYNDSVKEIARLIGGIKINDTILKAADDMKKQAENFKNKLYKY